MLNFPSESKTPVSSSKRKSVFLREWWLIEVGKDSRLGVGGFTNRETLGSRGMRLFGSASIGKSCNLDHSEAEIQVFHSAAVAKRLDNNTVEATDGITVTISGCINKSRTLSYGFLPEVCDRFLSGFPCNWEEYASKSSHGKCFNTFERSLPLSFDGLPVTRVRDMLMSATGESESRAFTSIIFRDILKQCGGDSNNQSAADSVDFTEIKLGHKQYDVSLNQSQKITEDDRKISSKETENDDNQGNYGFMSDETYKTTEKAQAKCAGTSPESPGQPFDPFSNVLDPKFSSQRRDVEEGSNTTTTNERITSRSQQQRYPLRSKKKRRALESQD